MISVLVIGLVIAVVVIFILIGRITSRLDAMEWKVLMNLEKRLDRIEESPVDQHASDRAGKTEGRRQTHEPSTPRHTGVEYADLGLEGAPAQGEAGAMRPAEPDQLRMGEPRISAAPSRTREEWEALIGGKILNRIGALAIVIAMAYFMKYAVDQDWIDETVRVLIGGVVGIGLWGWAFILNRKDFQVFAQGIVGAGIGILYLSVYAGHTFYGLVTFEVAFLMMAAVTLLTLIQALYYSSLTVGVLGLLGGYMTPFVLEGGETQVLGLLTYIFFLNSGLLAMVYRRERWWVIELMTFTGVWSVFLSWYLNVYTADDLGITVLFILLFWVKYPFLALLGAPAEGPPLTVRRCLEAATAAVMFLFLYDILDPLYHAWMGAFTLLISGSYVGIAVWIMRRRVEDAFGRMQHLLLAITFGIVATWVQFDGVDTVLAWSIEATVLSFIGMRSGLRYVRLSAIALFFLAALMFLGTDGAIFYAPLGGFVPVMNERAVALIVLAAGLLSTSFESSRLAVTEDRWTIRFSGYAGALVLFVLVVMEVNDHFNLLTLSAGVEEDAYYMFGRPVWMAVFWSAVSVLFVWVGVRKRHEEFLVSGLIMLAVAGCVIFFRGLMFDPPTMFDPLVNIRVLALTIVGGVYLGTIRLMQGPAVGHAWLPRVRTAAQFGVLLLGFSLLTGETRDYFEAALVRAGDETEGRIAGLRNMQQLALSGVWLVYSMLMIGAGIWRSWREVRIAAFMLFGLTILKIFLYDLSYLETLYRIISFVALGIVLLAVSFAYQRYKSVILARTEDTPDRKESA